MNELSNYLIDNLVLDFRGDVDMETLNELLLRDGSQLAHDLRARLISQDGVDDFLLVLADCLKDFLREGISEELVTEQILAKGGKIDVKMAPKAVSQREETELAAMMERLAAENEEMDGDEDD